MQDSIRDRFSRLRKSLSREVLLYIVFGVLTTVVNYIVFIGLNSAFGKDTPIWSGEVHLLSWSWPIVLRFWAISNIVAFLAAVTFAFITNRNIVFEAGTRTGDRKKDRAAMIRQGGLFWGARLITLAMEYAILFLLIDTLGLSDLLSKLVSNAFVIVGNYFFSKFVIFPKRIPAGVASTGLDAGDAVGR